MLFWILAVLVVAALWLWTQKRNEASPTFRMNPDKYKSIQEVQTALQEAGLETSNLIIGIDFTKSNTWNGKKTFGGKCLHSISGGNFNPYQSAISIIGRTLEKFDDDKLIPVFGFGDKSTTDQKVFSFHSDKYCNGLDEVMSRYTELAPGIELSGPTSFAPLIRASINIVKQTKQYHILLIIADGQVDNIHETTKAIVEASDYPLSIVCVGVGDGPWDLMEHFDDQIPERRFDNFQFVPFHNVTKFAENPEVAFSIAALQEIPMQYQDIKKLGLL